MVIGIEKAKVGSWEEEEIILSLLDVAVAACKKYPWSIHVCIITH
jgi:hypothetical protein